MSVDRVLQAAAVMAVAVLVVAVMVAVATVHDNVGGRPSWTVEDAATDARRPPVVRSIGGTLKAARARRHGGPVHVCAAGWPDRY